MTWFINVRAFPNGGYERDKAILCTQDGEPTDQDAAQAVFARDIRGHDLVLVSHGFNVTQAHGLASLTRWSSACDFPANALFIGLLWPGDSVLMPILDYPMEGQVAMRSAAVLADFVNDKLKAARSISFVSHSLGARFVLQTVRLMKRERISKLILMAGAIEDNCLSHEYADVAGKADEIHVIASRRDWVLEFAFPIGNPVGEIIMRDHPYFKCALGRDGPENGLPSGKKGDICQLPDGSSGPNDWDYGHLDYLPDSDISPLVPPVTGIPQPNDPMPSRAPDWKPRWSAGMVSLDINQS